MHGIIAGPMRCAGTGALVIGLLCVAAPARALEPGKIGDDAVQLDVTDATSVLMNWNNRNQKPLDVTSRADDDWSLWYNRLNVQASWGEWTLGVRVDNVWFFRSPYPEVI